MNRILTRAAATLGVAGAAFTAMVVTAPAASAATYNGGCGSGYYVINSASVGSVGTVFLTYNNSTKQNCVVTIRNSSGTAVTVCEEITRHGDGYLVKECEAATTWGGPIYINAPGQCVSWYGEINNVRGGKSRTNCG
ncbi:spore-associated protein A [Streptomyces werraensis]|uniref:spore-associated protein A n=1 Tax=Streptomyces werraensis TaxID=68284 RepID=UPI003442E9ED